MLRNSKQITFEYFTSSVRCSTIGYDQKLEPKIPVTHEIFEYNLQYKNIMLEAPYIPAKEINKK
jgi:gamma-glutamylcysteine synthetase